MNVKWSWLSTFEYEEIPIVCAHHQLKVSITVNIRQTDPVFGNVTAYLQGQSVHKGGRPHLSFSIDLTLLN